MKIRRLRSELAERDNKIAELEREIEIFERKDSFVAKGSKGLWDAD